MGGNVPLGYDVKDRKLIANETEASTVRVIFRRYAELGSVALLRGELDQQDFVSKRREGASGRNVSKPSSLMNAALLTSGKEHGLFSLSSRYQGKEFPGGRGAPWGSP